MSSVRLDCKMGEKRAMPLSEDEKSSPMATVLSFCGAWAGPDMDRVISHLGEDIVYHNIPMAELSGLAAVERYLRAAGPFEHCVWEVRAVAANGEQVLTERIDRMTVRRRMVTLPVMGTFRVRGGLIREWRDYFDLASYLAQLA